MLRELPLFGAGSMLGLSGAVPLPLLWTGGPALTAIALAAIGYLTLSAAVLVLLPRRASRKASVV